MNQHRFEAESRGGSKPNQPALQPTRCIETSKSVRELTPAEIAFVVGGRKVP